MSGSEKGHASRPRLGRGLSSLVINSTEPADGQYRPEPAGEAASHEAAGGVREVPVEQIAPNPFQPRRDFDEAEIASLADSISQQGVLQPLLLAGAADATADKPFLLIAGERRLRAAKRAGLQTVPCVVRRASRQDMLEWALVENIHRTDLNPIERANAYREYMERFGLSQGEAAERLGQARTTVANHLRLLDLPNEVQQEIASGALSFGHAKVLAGLAGQPERQEQLARECIDKGLAVRQLESLVAEWPTGAPPERSETSPQAKPRPAYLTDLEEQLTRAVGTRVSIRPGRGKHTGRIVIHYYSLDDFDHIATSLGATLES